MEPFFRAHTVKIHTVYQEADDEPLQRNKKPNQLQASVMCSAATFSVAQSTTAKH